MPRFRHRNKAPVRCKRHAALMLPVIYLRAHPPFMRFVARRKTAAYLIYS